MNTYGDKFRVTLYGESHGKEIGCIIDGMPHGIKVDHDLIFSNLERRRPKGYGSSKRVEKDVYEITSGVFNGYTTGGAIHVRIANLDIDSKDYQKYLDHPRPNHTDFVAKIKYDGFHDFRGSGHFSGRITVALVVAGSFAKMVLKYPITSRLISVGSLKDMSKLDEYLKEIESKKDSVGGVVELKVENLPIGLGEPFFHKLDSEIAKILFSIPSVKGVFFGEDMKYMSLLGSEYNDLIVDHSGKTKSNNSGGVVGGISNGNDLMIHVYIKPTASIGLPQETFNFQTKKVEPLIVEGRHDACIARRIGVVLENALAICLMNFMDLK